jgi:hypothetical protein
MAGRWRKVSPRIPAHLQVLSGLGRLSLRPECLFLTTFVDSIRRIHEKGAPILSLLALGVLPEMEPYPQPWNHFFGSQARTGLERALAVV